MKKEKILAIIPARGGSKRIPRKNVKPFLGVPIISYSINAALEARIFDEIMVSTDDLEIAKVSTDVGAKIPFMRSQKNSDDFATLSDVFKEVLLKYEEKGEHFKYFCCIYPTAPLLDFKLLRKSLKILKENKFDSVLSVISHSHPIQRALYINNEGNMEMINKKFINTRTQDLPKTFYDAGQFFFTNTEKFLNEGKMLANKIKSIELNELYAQDIDNENDWINAELKYKIIKKKNKRL